mgnify:CR=1 FL=1
MGKKRKHRNQPQAVTPKPQTLGQRLVEARVKLGIELSDLHARTKVSLSALQALEQEQWDLLPAPVYVRGFLKLVSRELELSYEELVSLLPENADRQAPLPSIRQIRKVQFFQPSLATPEEEKGNKEEKEGRVSSALIVFILLVLATLAISYIGSQKESQTHSSPSASEVANFDVTG